MIYMYLYIINLVPVLLLQYLVPTFLFLDGNKGSHCPADYAVIFCRKASIDQFMDGLMFRELFQQFPALCEPLFVYSSTCSQPTPLKLLDMLKVHSGATVVVQQTFSFVKEYVSGLSAEGMYHSSICVSTVSL